MPHKLLPLACLFYACAGSAPPPPTVPEGARRVETLPLPTHPGEETIPEGFRTGNWSVPVDEGSCIDKDGKMVTPIKIPCPPHSGILFSEEKTYRAKLYKLGYEQLLVNYKADRHVWEKHRELYETRLRMADEAIKDLQPGWWDRHKLELGVIGGFTVGALMAGALFLLAN